METVYLNELVHNGYKPTRVNERLRKAVRERIERGEEIFPEIFGLEMEKRRIAEVLMAGRGVLLTGQYGTGKTEISKAVKDLLTDYYKHHEVFYPEICPVQEEPFNIAYSLEVPEVRKRGYKLRDACPVCRAEYCNGKKVDLKDVELVRFEKPVEGKGFARVQGGSDVTPEELIGTFNLKKLAEIGDPFNPEVFQPGKIGQASGGVLFVDELGKLGESGQYALIQASEEGCVTPAKSRETFPVDELLIATTNPVDEDNIIGAVLDRLVSIRIPIVDYENEVKIVENSLRKKEYEEAPYVPKAFLNVMVKAVRKVRESKPELEIGPRTSINAGLIARESAFFDGRSVANICDVKEGVYAALLGKATFDEKDSVEAEIRLPSIRDELERLYGIDSDELKAGIEVLKEMNREEPFSPENIRRAEREQRCSNQGYRAKRPEVKSFVDRVREMEKLKGNKLYEVVGVYYQAYDRGC